MAESNLDLSVGKHWLAYRALQGDENMDCVLEYVSCAVPMLATLIESQLSAIDEASATELVGLLMFISELQRALTEAGDSEFKVEIKRRKPGKPINKAERARVGHKAASMVSAAVQMGTKQEAAIADAVNRTGLSRSEVFKWLRTVRTTQAKLDEWLARREAERAGKDWLPPLSG